VTDLDRLRRWEDSGGTWRVALRRAGSLTIALCRCDGGEEVDLFTTTERAALVHVGDRETSEDAEADSAG
jgi:hypothetical protein